MYTHLSYDIMFKLSLGCVFKEKILILITGSASNFILRCTNDVPLFSFHLREQPLLFINKIDPNLFLSIIEIKFTVLFRITLN